MIDASSTQTLTPAITNQVATSEAALSYLAVRNLSDRLSKPLSSFAPISPTQESLAFSHLQQSSRSSLKQIASVLVEFAKIWDTPAPEAFGQEPLALSQLNGQTLSRYLSASYDTELHSNAASLSFNKLGSVIEHLKAGLDSIRSLSLNKLDSVLPLASTPHPQAFQLPLPSQGNWATLEHALSPYRQDQRWHSNVPKAQRSYDAPKQQQSANSLWNALAKDAKSFLSALRLLFNPHPNLNAGQDF